MVDSCARRSSTASSASARRASRATWRTSSVLRGTQVLQSLRDHDANGFRSVVSKETSDKAARQRPRVGSCCIRSHYDRCHRQWRQRMSTRHINPEGLHHHPAYSQAVVVEQPAKTIYIGGQNGVDADDFPVGVDAVLSADVDGLCWLFDHDGLAVGRVVVESLGVDVPCAHALPPLTMTPDHS